MTCDDERPAYLDPSQPVEKRVEDLLSRMTLEEKVGQMCQYSGFSEQHEKLIREGRVGSLLNVFGAENVNRVQRVSVEHSRLGIPLIFGLDVIHGYVTTFPIPLGLASTWDPDIVKRSASVAALEASSDGINWTFAPMWVSPETPDGAGLRRVLERTRTSAPSWPRLWWLSFKEKE